MIYIIDMEKRKQKRQKTVVKKRKRKKLTNKTSRTKNR
jgi:hypothetical protein|tara:strand:- start:9255 stop:9368 length:114 start_codon:yes stop_codon:yes gene_type:complete